MSSCPAVTDQRSWFLETYANLGLGLSLWSGFVEAAWAPEVYAGPLGVDASWRSVRADLGRRFGDATAGLAVSFLSRGAQYNLTTFTVFTDFSIGSRRGTAMKVSATR